MVDPLYWEIDSALEPDEDSHCPDCGSRYDGIGFCPFCDYEPDDPEWLFYEFDDSEGDWL
jgi:hypothetical protein